MFSSKPVWHLPVALLAVSFLLYASIGLWFSEWISDGFRRRPPNALDVVLSPTTIDALYEDDRLHHAILSLTETVAKASTKYGDSYRLEGVKSFGKDLTEDVARLRVTQVQKRRKRGLLEDLGSLITGGGGDGQQGQDQGGLLSELGNALGGNGTGGLGGLLQQGLAGIGNSLLEGAATPAYFLGIGIGMGAETGLNLTDMEQAQAIATKVAASSNSQPTGLNLIAQNLGSGLAGQLTPALGNLGGDVDVGMAVFALAQGIGQGSASGLNLTSQQFGPSNASDIMGIAKNFGLGVSEPIAGSINFQQLLGQGGGSDIMAQIPQIAAAAGQGLGEGASNGLGLAKAGNTSSLSRRQAATDPSQLDVPGTVSDFTRGLSQAFLGSADLSKLGLGGGLNFSLDSTALVSLASGAGKGIGEGVAIGLNLTAAGNVTSPATGGAGANEQEQIAEQFTQGLVAALLQNGGTTFLQNAISSQGLTKTISPAKAAEGAARGLVEGSVNALSMAGGVKKVLAGDFSPQLAMNLPSMPPSTFDDSVNGSAVAFARGLSGEGTLLIAQLLKNSSLLSPSKRSIDTSESGVVPYNHLNRRADATPLAVDSQTIQGVLQVGTNAITCQGFGGLASLALGLKNSGTLNIQGSGTPLDNSTLAALPKEPISITSEGNKFTIQIQEGSITVNGLKSLPFIVLTALHVLLTTFAFFYALPAYLALGALFRLSQLIGHPFNEASNKKWRKIILLAVFTPSALLGMIFGIVGMGKAQHFRTAHGIFGLLALLIIPPTVITSFMRLRTAIPPPPSSAFLGLKQIPQLIKGPHKIHLISAFLVQQTLGFGMIAFIQGFSDLRSISLCIVDAVLTAPIVVGLINVVVFLQMSAMALLGVRVYLEQRIAKKEKEGAGNSSGPGAEKGDVKRSDTMRTFGFDSPPPGERPTFQQRKTAELLGREDSKIGWPSNVHKVGDEDGVPDRRASSMSTNPFVDPAEQAQRSPASPRVYNPKLGGYVESPTSAYPGNYDRNDQTYAQNRPSSELEPQGQYIAYAPPRPSEDQRGKTVESFSRPLTGKPSGEEMRVKYESLIRDGMGKDDGPYGYGR